MKLQYRMKIIMQRTSTQNIQKPIVGRIMTIKKDAFTDIRNYWEKKIELDNNYAQGFEKMERLLNRICRVYIGFFEIKNHEANRGRLFL